MCLKLTNERFMAMCLGDAKRVQSVTKLANGIRIFAFLLEFCRRQFHWHITGKSVVKRK